MTVKISPLFNDAQLDSSGNPASGYKLFTYTASSSTKQTTYQDSAAGSSHTNPIILNSRGEPPAPIWLTTGVAYKFVFTSPTDTDPPVSAIRSIDNVSGVNDTTTTLDEWVLGPAPTFVSATSFTLSGDQTSTFHLGRRLKSTNSGGTVYSTIITTVFGVLTTVTVANDSSVLDSGLSAVSYGLVRADNPSISPAMIARKGTAVASAATTNIWGIVGDYVHITGVVAITSLGTAPYAGAARVVVFDGALTLTHNATTLVLPGGANITTAANDIAVVRADTTANMIVVSYVKAASAPLTFATNATTLTGTETAQAVTPAGLKSVMGLTKLNSGAASGATLDIVMTSYTAYRHKLLVFDLLPATDAVTLALRFSTDGGSTYDAGGTDYSYARKVHTSLAADSSDGADANGIQIQSSIGNASGEGIAGELKILNGTSTTLWTKATWQTSNIDSGAGVALVSSTGAGTRRAAQDTDAIRLLFSSGNITSGNWTLYGYN